MIKKFQFHSFMNKNKLSFFKEIIHIGENPNIISRKTNEQGNMI